MHKTHTELVECQEFLRKALETGELEYDRFIEIVIQILEDIDNLQFGGE